MGLLAVASAKGSPGVTTTSMLLAALWPRPSLVAECDASGGSIFSICVVSRSSAWGNFCARTSAISSGSVQAPSSISRLTLAP